MYNMTRRIGISVSDWVFNEFISRAKNHSKRFEELVMKGILYEKGIVPEKEQALKKQAQSPNGEIPASFRGCSPWLEDPFNSSIFCNLSGVFS